MGEIAPGAGDRLIVHDPVVVLQIERQVVPGDHRLEPVATGSGDPVGRVAVVDPRREVGVVIARVARRWGDHDHVLPFGLQQRPERAAEQILHPRARGHHDHVGLEALALQTGPLGGVGGDPAPLHPTAEILEPRHGGLHAPLGVDEPAFRLPQAVANSLRVYHRQPGLDLVRRAQEVRDTELVERLLGGVLPAVFRSCASIRAPHSTYSSWPVSAPSSIQRRRASRTIAV